MPRSFAKARTQLELAVRQLIRLNTPNKQGVSRKQTLESGRKQFEKAGKSREWLDERFSELRPVELIKGTEELLVVFDQLSNARPYGMSGPAPIAFTEIKAYCELMDCPLARWEVETIKVLDAAFLEEAHALTSQQAS